LRFSEKADIDTFKKLFFSSNLVEYLRANWNLPEWSICGLYYKRVTIVIDAPSVIKVMLQIVASLTIVIDDAS